MNDRIHKIENDVQDRNSIAWKKLCDYVEKVAIENKEEFSPLEELGQELFSQIHTLPETISKLKKVKKLWLYGSKLKRIPPEKHIISKIKTTNIERRNRDFRTHIKRLCRETVCFSKKDDMHYGLLKAYIFLRNKFGKLVKTQHIF